MNFFEEQTTIINCIVELLQQYTEINNKILDIYLKHNLTQYQIIKDIIESSKDAAPQRTAEWYKLRGTCITASDVGAFLGMDKYKSQKKVIEMKSSPVQASFSNKFTVWGNKYENIAASIYEKMFNVKIYEAPLLIHPVYPFLGASCDGFVVDENNKHGYIIEIKCPLPRQLGDCIPDHYISQPRTQMEVVKIDRCDFFECKLEEYPDQHSFEIDTESEYKGFIISYGFFHDLDDNGISKQYFIYPDDIFDHNIEPYMQKVNEIPDASNVRPVFWKLSDYRNHTIIRDPQWLKESIPILEKCWDTIIHNRRNNVA